MISVLIAVYNAEPFLAACLDSLLKQSMTDFEALCVDDASTDHSLDILRKYEQSDARIRVFSCSANQGQAVARNIALKHAQGDIIMFLDADDHLDKEALRIVTDTFQTDDNIDAVLFRLSLCFPDGSISDYPINTQTTHFTGTEAARRSISWNGIHGVYAIRADIHHRYPYDATCRTYSDDITSTLHFLHCRLVATSEARYFYRQHEQSVTHQVSLRRFDILTAKQRLIERLHQEASPADFHKIAATQLWLWLIDCCQLYYMHHTLLTHDEQQQALALMRRTWAATNLPDVDRRLLCKFGYMHLPSWSLFRLQNYIYFSLRKLIKS